MSILASELEAERAAALKSSLDPTADYVYHGDAFRLSRTTLPDSGATVLYLNPPYDQDPEYRRLEHRFLVRFTQHLHPGAGFLLYLVPYPALEPSAEFLARHFLDLRAWRLPEPDFSRFHQVLLVGRGRTGP
jgi:23S rRNA A2030 N6-methylase RlmJ